MPPSNAEFAARQLLDERLRDSDLLTARINQAVRNAVLAHKAAGNPVCTWKDGKVVWIQPEDIDLPEIWTPGDDVSMSDAS